MSKANTDSSLRRSKRKRVCNPKYQSSDEEVKSANASIKNVPKFCVKSNKAPKIELNEEELSLFKELESDMNQKEETKKKVLVDREHKQVHVNNEGRRSGKSSVAVSDAESVQDAKVVDPKKGSHVNGKTNGQSLSVGDPTKTSHLNQKMQRKSKKGPENSSKLGVANLTIPSTVSGNSTTGGLMNASGQNNMTATKSSTGNPAPDQDSRGSTVSNGMITSTDGTTTTPVTTSGMNSLLQVINGNSTSVSNASAATCENITKPLTMSNSTSGAPVATSFGINPSMGQGRTASGLMGSVAAGNPTAAGLAAAATAAQLGGVPLSSLPAGNAQAWALQQILAQVGQLQALGALYTSPQSAGGDPNKLRSLLSGRNDVAAALSLSSALISSAIGGYPNQQGVTAPAPNPTAKKGPKTTRKYTKKKQNVEDKSTGSVNTAAGVPLNKNGTPRKKYKKRQQAEAPIDEAEARGEDAHSLLSTQTATSGTATSTPATSQLWQQLKTQLNNVSNGGADSGTQSAAVSKTGLSKDTESHDTTSVNGEESRMEVDSSNSGTSHKVKPMSPSGVAATASNSDSGKSPSGNFEESCIVRVSKNESKYLVELDAKRTEIEKLELTASNRSLSSLIQNRTKNLANLQKYVSSSEEKETRTEDVVNGLKTLFKSKGDGSPSIIIGHQMYFKLEETTRMKRKLSLNN